MVNGRVFYACLGVLVNKPGSGSTRFGRNNQTVNEDIGDFLYLNGVRSVGVSSDFVSRSIMDVGRFQKRFHYYSPQEFEITIERVITINLFYFCCHSIGNLFSFCSVNGHYTLLSVN